MDEQRAEALNLCGWANFGVDVTPETYEAVRIAFQAGVRWSAAMHHLRALAGRVAICSQCAGLGLVVRYGRICTCGWCDATGIARDGDLDAAPWLDVEAMIAELRETWAIFAEDEERDLRAS